MTMAAESPDERIQRGAFARLRELRAQMAAAGHRLPGAVDGHVGRLSRGGRRGRDDGKAGNPALRRTAMTDDAFHLTSHDVRAQEFQRVLRGYDPAQVEEFKQRMAEEIDRLVRDGSSWTNGSGA
jgi:DivIVA domain-containing protein